MTPSFAANTIGNGVLPIPSTVNGNAYGYGEGTTPTILHPRTGYSILPSIVRATVDAGLTW